MSRVLVALLPPLGVPLSPWSKALVWLAETVAGGIIWQQFDEGAEMQPTSSSGSSEGADQWRKFVFKVEDAISLDSADDQYFSVDLANITNGAIDSSWTDADYSAVFGALDGFATEVAGRMCTRYAIKELRAYRRAFLPYSSSKPFADSGAPEKIWSMNRLGLLPGQVPPQVSITITEMTASRANWGRMYLPAPGTSAIDDTGRLEANAYNGLINALHLAYDDLMGAEFFPVVPTTSVGGTKVQPNPVRSLQVVSGVRIDDVLDVQRSRRHKNHQVRITKPL